MLHITLYTMLLQELWLEYENVAYNTVYHAFARTMVGI